MTDLTQIATLVGDSVLAVIMLLGMFIAYRLTDRLLMILAERLAALDNAEQLKIAILSEIRDDLRNVSK